MKANLEKRVAALEERRTYRVDSMAAFSILCAWTQSGDPRKPREEDIVWSPAFEDLRDGTWLERAEKREAKR